MDAQEKACMHEKGTKVITNHRDMQKNYLLDKLRQLGLDSAFLIQQHRLFLFHILSLSLDLLLNSRLLFLFCFQTQGSKLTSGSYLRATV
jgi:hypothetical protein